jgi:hypothetical protein
VAKVLSVDALTRAMEPVPVPVDGAGGFSCRTRARDVLGELARQWAVSGFKGWEEVNREAEEYVERSKKEES